MSKRNLLAEQGQIIGNQKRKIESGASLLRLADNNINNLRAGRDRATATVAAAQPLAELGRWVADLLDLEADAMKVTNGAAIVRYDNLRERADGYRAAAEALAPKT